MGHLLWLILAEKKEAADQTSKLFAANYWVSGAMMNSEDTSSWLPDDSATDNAYQWIKFQECLDLFEGDLKDSWKGIRSALKPLAHGWWDELHHLDTRDIFAWPRSQEDGTGRFRLDDHIWIWRGLKAVCTLLHPTNHDKYEATNEVTLDSKSNRQDHGQEGNSDKQNEEDAAILKQLKRFDYRDIQRHILRHFTTENEFSRKRMLAVTRTSKDTRFLLHARDTALLYARDWHFTPDRVSQELWGNTMRVQVEHDENQETRWANPLRYALSIAMASNNLSINENSPSDMIEIAIDVLIMSSSPNGLFAGELDEATKEAAIFSKEGDRDFYFHAGFETSYILFTNAVEITNVAKKQAALEHTKSDQNVQPVARVTQRQTNENLSSANTHSGVAADVVTPVSRYMIEQGQVFQRPALAMKKSMPFSYLVDADSIVDVGDEWLYNYPVFLGSKSDTEYTRFQDAYVAMLRHKEARFWQPLGGESDSEKSDPKRMRYWKDPLPRQSLMDALFKFPCTPIGGAENFTFMESESKWSLTEAKVRDIGKKKLKGKKSKIRDHHCPEFEDGEHPRPLKGGELFKCLCKLRNPMQSKKRFIWIPKFDIQIAISCCLGSHSDEVPEMVEFFDRHARREQSFHDETTMFLNKWETELQLSFYQLLQPDNPISSNEDAPKPVFNLPGSGKYQVAMAALGFRFSGDFFDRFWTCHLVESTNGGCAAKQGNLWSGGNQYDRYLDRFSRAWRQRKFLELHLLERILTDLVVSTRKLFETLKSENGLADLQRAFSSMNPKDNDYFTSSRDWQDVQQSLKDISDQLERVNFNIMKWESREVDRGPERPRWTRNDEMKYRSDIKRLIVSTNSEIQEFRSLHAEIDSFREWLMRRQDQIRDDYTFRGSENIRFFTYATVIFLPLGFASSIFSMNGVPESGLVGSMAAVAIVALMLTVIALMSAPKIGSAIRPMFTAVDGGPQRYKENSLLFQLYAGAGHEYGGSNEEKQPKRPERRKSLPDAWIWLLYLLTEFPALIVLLAYRSMKNGKLSLLAVLSIVAGIILLPWCLCALVAQVIVANVADLVSILYCASAIYRFTSSSFWLTTMKCQRRIPSIRYPSRMNHTEGNGIQKICDHSQPQSSGCRND